MAHILFIDSNECGLDVVRRAKELDHQVTFVASSISQVYSNSPENEVLFENVDHLFTTKYTSCAEEIIDLLRDHVVRYSIDAAIAPFEGTLEATARVCVALGIPFSTPEAVETARNKERARAALVRAGLTNAQYRMVLTVDEALAAAEEIGYPVILKPKSGIDSICVGRIDTPKELSEAANRALNVNDNLPAKFLQMKEQFSRGILVEQRLTGKMVSLEIGIRGDETYFFMCSGRQNTEIDECLPMGAFMPSDLSEADRKCCQAYAEQVCRILGLTFGLYHIEVMLTDKGPALIEANARLMGGIMPRIYRMANNGCAIEDYLLRLHLNQPIEEPLPTASCTALVRRFIAAENGIISERLSSACLREFSAKAAEFANYNLAPGKSLNRLDLLGRVIVTGPNFETAAAKGDVMIVELERLIGVSLVRTAIDFCAPTTV